MSEWSTTNLICEGRVVIGGSDPHRFHVQSRGTGVFRRFVRLDLVQR